MSLPRLVQGAVVLPLEEVPPPLSECEEVTLTTDTEEKGSKDILAPYGGAYGLQTNGGPGGFDLDDLAAYVGKEPVLIRRGRDAALRPRRRLRPPPRRGAGAGPARAPRGRGRGAGTYQQQRCDFDTLVESHRTVRGLVPQPRLDIDARR